MRKSIVTMCAMVGMGLHATAADAKPDVPTQAVAQQREKEFTVENKFLVMPITNNKGDKGGGIKLYIDGKPVRNYGIKLAPSAEEADWYAFFTIENYKGKKAKVEERRPKRDLP